MFNELSNLRSEGRSDDQKYTSISDNKNEIMERLNRLEKNDPNELKDDLFHIFMFGGAYRNDLNTIIGREHLIILGHLALNKNDQLIPQDANKAPNILEMHAARNHDSIQILIEEGILTQICISLIDHSFSISKRNVFVDILTNTLNAHQDTREILVHNDIVSILIQLNNEKEINVMYLIQSLIECPAYSTEIAHAFEQIIFGYSIDNTQFSNYFHLLKIIMLKDDTFNEKIFNSCLQFISIIHTFASPYFQIGLIKLTRSFLVKYPQTLPIFLQNSLVSSLINVIDHDIKKELDFFDIAAFVSRADCLEIDNGIDDFNTNGCKKIVIDELIYNIFILLNFIIDSIESDDFLIVFDLPIIQMLRDSPVNVKNIIFQFICFALKKLNSFEMLQQYVNEEFLIEAKDISTTDEENMKVVQDFLMYCMNFSANPEFIQMINIYYEELEKG